MDTDKKLILDTAGNRGVHLDTSCYILSLFENQPFQTHDLTQPTKNKHF